MPTIYIGIGSNKDRSKNIINTISALRMLFSEITLSNIYESKAVGFVGENFCNLVACFDTSISIELLTINFKKIEKELGRKKTEAEVLIDIDILLYGNEINQEFNLPRTEITEQAFILRPLSEISPNLKHPILNDSYKELWDKFPQTKQPLKQVKLVVETI